MDDYLSKPIELRQLSLLVARWLGDDSHLMRALEPEDAINDEDFGGARPLTATHRS